MLFNIQLINVKFKSHLEINLASRMNTNRFRPLFFERDRGETVSILKVKLFINQSLLSKIVYIYKIVLRPFLQLYLLTLVTVKISTETIITITICNNYRYCILIIRLYSFHKILIQIAMFFMNQVFLDQIVSDVKELVFILF